MQIYNHAIEKQYSFLYVDLVAKNKDDMFYENLNKKIVVSD